MGRIPEPGRLKVLIEKHGGVIADIARARRVTRQTVYNWLDLYDMRGEIKTARQQIREVAGDVIYDRMFSQDEDAAFEAAKFVMLHVANDGELLVLSPEVVKILAERGISLDQAARVLEQLVLAEARGEPLP